MPGTEKENTAEILEAIKGEERSHIECRCDLYSGETDYENYERPWPAPLRIDESDIAAMYCRATNYASASEAVIAATCPFKAWADAVDWDALDSAINVKRKEMLAKWINTDTEAARFWLDRHPDQAASLV